MLQNLFTALRYRAAASISCKLITLKNKSDLLFFICAVCTIQKAAGIIEVIPVGESLRERKLEMIIKCFTGLCQG